METKLVNGLDPVFDFTLFGKEAFNMLKKLPDIKKMSESQLHNEFWEIQDKFEHLNLLDNDDVETESVLMKRQQILSNEFESRSGVSLG